MNIKWYLRREGTLDLSDSPDLDYYLVLTGPPAPAASSRDTTRPWSVEAVYLFRAKQLHDEQRARGVKLGVASSLLRQQWIDAEVYPSRRNAALPVTPEQTALLMLFQQTSAPFADA